MKNLQKEYGLYINGKWQPASDGATFKTYSPATGEELAVCAEATREDVDAAVKAAHAAWESWKNTTPVERAVILNKIADIINANAQHLAEVESLDNGKPIRETSMIDIPMSADHFRYFAAAIRHGRRHCHHARQQHFKPRPARAYRSSGADYSVELPIPHGSVEAGSGTGRGRLHCA